MGSAAEETEHPAPALHARSQGCDHRRVESDPPVHNLRIGGLGASQYPESPGCKREVDWCLSRGRSEVDLVTIGYANSRNSVFCLKMPYLLPLIINFKFENMSC